MTTPRRRSPMERAARALARTPARLALALCVLCAAGSHARAQIDLAADPTSSWQGLHWTGEALRKAFASDLDRDGRVDLVLLSDGRHVVWSSSPAERQHRRVLTVGGYAATVDDVALQLDGPGGDALLTANQTGVHQWTYDPAEDAFDVVTLRAHPAGFARVACAREVAGVYRAAYALGVDQRTVYPMLFHVSTGVEVFPLQSFDLGVAAGAIEAADLDGNGMAELVAVTQANLVVRGVNGTLVASFPRTSSQDPSTDRLVVLQDPGSSSDQLAWVVREGATSKLRVLSQAGLGNAFDLGPDSILQLAAGDIDGDGLSDLALAPDLGPRVRVLRSVSNVAPRFLLSEPNDGELLPSDWFIDQETLDDAALAVGDFDRDGDLDVALAAMPREEDGASLTLWRGLAVDHGRRHPQLRDGSVAKHPFVAQLYDVELALEAPPDPIVADTLRWRVWQQLPLEARSADFVPVQEGEAPAPQHWPWTLQLELGAQQDWNANWTVEILLVDTQSGQDVLHAALLAAASAMQIENVLLQAEPGYDLWGTWFGIGGAVIGEGGVGGVPRVPPPPVPPEPPDPPQPIP